MKTKPYIFLTVVMLLCWTNLKAQQVNSDHIVKTVETKIKRTKTLSSWDLLSNLYQISLSNLTADDKNITLKGTIYAIDVLLNKDAANSENYRRKALERHIEPYLKFNYQDKFNPSNLTAGLNWSFINQNDATESKAFNSFNKDLMKKIENINGLMQPVYKLMKDKMQSEDPKKREELAEKGRIRYAQLAKFMLSGNENDLTDSLKYLLNAEQIQAIKDCYTTLDEVALKVNNGWNVTFSPQVTYAFNRSAFQGASFLFNGIKGFKLFEKRSTQLTLKGGYIMGADSIVKIAAINQQQLTGSFGFNQVIFIKDIKADDGTVSKAPCTELAISGGYNWLTRGYSSTEKRGQPTLGAKLGFLVGKDSWLVFPFTYNFATKDSYASVSIKVNLGDAPFK